MTSEQIWQNIRFTDFTANPAFRTWSAADQREMFGGAPFGRRRIRWDATLRVIETKVMTISRDWDIQSYTLDEVAELVASGRPARKGYSGYGVKRY